MFHRLWMTLCPSLKIPIPQLYETLYTIALFIVIFGFKLLSRTYIPPKPNLKDKVSNHSEQSAPSLFCCATKQQLRERELTNFISTMNMIFKDSIWHD